MANDAPSPYDLAGIIEHTLLNPGASHEDLKTLCEQAQQHGFVGVCVNAVNVRYCASVLRGTSVKPITVVGFPLGGSTPAAKAFAAREAVHNGALEVDMVIHVGALKNREYGVVMRDIEAVVQAVAPMPVKVIVEMALLSQQEKMLACALAEAAGAAFVKTSTGFGPGGATVEDVALMRQVVGERLGVKASGGVRTAAMARALVAAGASRLGCSASVAIVTSSVVTSAVVERSEQKRARAP